MAQLEADQEKLLEARESGIGGGKSSQIRKCNSVRSQLPNKAKLSASGAAGLQCSCLITVWSGQMTPRLVLHSVHEAKLPKYQSVGY